MVRRTIRSRSAFGGKKIRGPGLGAIRTLFCLLVFSTSLGIAARAQHKTGDTGLPGKEIPTNVRAAAGSDPTKPVRFQDTRSRYLDLENGKSIYDVSTDGQFVFSPNFKISNELHYFVTDISGNYKSEFESLQLTPTFSTELFKLRKINGRAIFGLNWVKNLGDFEDGTGSGSDQIGPLVGLGLNLTDYGFFALVVQYVHSYSEEDNAPDINATTSRLLFVRAIDEFNGWARAEFRSLINHENDDKFSLEGELQLGKVIADNVGLFAEIRMPLRSQPFDYGVGIGLRVLY